MERTRETLPIEKQMSSNTLPVNFFPDGMSVDSQNPRIRRNVCGNRTHERQSKRADRPNNFEVKGDSREFYPVFDKRNVPKNFKKGNEENFEKMLECDARNKGNNRKETMTLWHDVYLRRKRESEASSSNESKMNINNLLPGNQKNVMNLKRESESSQLLKIEMSMESSVSNMQIETCRQKTNIGSIISNLETMEEKLSWNKSGNNESKTDIVSKNEEKPKNITIFSRNKNKAENIFEHSSKTETKVNSRILNSQIETNRYKTNAGTNFSNLGPSEEKSSQINSRDRESKTDLVSKNEEKPKNITIFSRNANKVENVFEHSSKTETKVDSGVLNSQIETNRYKINADTNFSDLGPSEEKLSRINSRDRESKTDLVSKNEEKPKNITIFSRNTNKAENVFEHSSKTETKVDSGVLNSQIETNRYKTNAGTNFSNLGPSEEKSSQINSRDRESKTDLVSKNEEKPKNITIFSRNMKKVENMFEHSSKTETKVNSEILNSQIETNRFETNAGTNFSNLELIEEKFSRINSTNHESKTDLISKNEKNPENITIFSRNSIMNKILTNSDELFSKDQLDHGNEIDKVKPFNYNINKYIHNEAQICDKIEPANNSKTLNTNAGTMHSVNSENINVSDVKQKCEVSQFIFPTRDDCSKINSINDKVDVLPTSFSKYNNSNANDSDDPDLSISDEEIPKAEENFQTTFKQPLNTSFQSKLPFNPIFSLNCNEPKMKHFNLKLGTEKNSSFQDNITNNTKNDDMDNNDDNNSDNDSDDNGMSNNVHYSDTHLSEYDIMSNMMMPKIMIHTNSNKSIKILENLKDSNFSSNILHKLVSHVKSLTEIQTIIWPSITSGYNTFVVSGPKSGKTFDVLIPIFDFILNMKPEAQKSGPFALIICSTLQSMYTIENWCHYFCTTSMNRMKVLRIDDNNSDFHNVQLLARGCSILISSPSIVRFTKYKASTLNLKELSFVVFDEVHLFNNDFCENACQIHEMCLNEADQKNRKLQVIALSNEWCKLLNHLSNQGDDSVICVSALQECVLYSETKLKLHLLPHEIKINHLLKNMVEKKNSYKKAIILCNHDKEVHEISEILNANGIRTLSATSTSIIGEDSQVYTDWINLSKHLKRIILVCTDNYLHMFNIQDADYLISYSLPDNFLTFNKRHVSLIKTFPNKFAKRKCSWHAKIDIFVDESNILEFPKVIHFVKRCGVKFETKYEKLLEKFFYLREMKKVSSGVQLCEKILDFGKCSKDFTCLQRHNFSSEHDSLKDWIPKSGYVKFKLIYVHNICHYSVRLIEHISLDGKIDKMEQNYLSLSMKLISFFLNEDKHRPYINPEPEDICAVELKPSVFYRCKIIKKYSNHKKNDEYIVNLIDEERYVRVHSFSLFELPNDLKFASNNIIHIKLVGLSPLDGSSEWNSKSKDDIEKYFRTMNNFFMRGKIVFGSNNCLWLESVQCCTTLSSCNRTIVKSNVKQYILNNNMALKNDEHLKLMYDICKACSFLLPEYSLEKKQIIIKTKPKVIEPQWAHLDSDTFTEVYFSSALHFNTFFVRIAKFNDSLESLLRDINKYIKEYKNNIKNTKNVSFEKGDYCIARFTDGLLYRARIDLIEQDENALLNNIIYKCFFVDYGDWLMVNADDVYPITSKIISQMPFQAVECRLLGVELLNNKKEQDAIDLLEDLSYNNNNIDLKKLSLLYLIKETPYFTKGQKYAVVLFDSDVLLNDIFVRKEYVKYNETEDNFLEFAQNKFKEHKTNENNENTESENNDEGNQNDCEEIDLNDYNLSIEDTDDDDDEFDVQFGDNELFDLFGIINKNGIPSINASNNDSKVIKALDNSDLTGKDNSKKDVLCSAQENNEVKINVSDVIESSSENLQCSHKTPSIIWYENTKFVFMKIELIGVEKYVLNISETSVLFETNLRGDFYYFNLDLIGCVDIEKSFHSATGLYICVKLFKSFKKKWGHLTTAKNKYKCIKYDVNFCDLEDESASTLDRNPIQLKKELLERICNQEDSDDDESDDSTSSDLMIE